MIKQMCYHYLILFRNSRVSTLSIFVERRFPPRTHHRLLVNNYCAVNFCCTEIGIEEGMTTLNSETIRILVNVDKKGSQFLILQGTLAATWTVALPPLKSGLDVAMSVRLHTCRTSWMIHPTPTPPSNTPSGSGRIGALSCSQSSERCRAFGIDCLH